jgi:hypothetical protein
MAIESQLAVSVREAVRLLSICPRTLRYHIRRKNLVARKIGRRIVIPMQSLELFLGSDHESPNRAEPQNSA